MVKPSPSFSWGDTEYDSNSKNNLYVISSIYTVIYMFVPQVNTLIGSLLINHHKMNLTVNFSYKIYLSSSPTHISLFSFLRSWLGVLWHYTSPTPLRLFGRYLWFFVRIPYSSWSSRTIGPLVDFNNVSPTLLHFVTT